MTSQQTTQSTSELPHRYHPNSFLPDRKDPDLPDLDAYLSVFESCGAPVGDYEITMVDDLTGTSLNPRATPTQLELSVPDWTRHLPDPVPAVTTGVNGLRLLLADLYGLTPRTVNLEEIEGDFEELYPNADRSKYRSAAIKYQQVKLALDTAFWNICTLVQTPFDFSIKYTLAQTTAHRYHFQKSFNHTGEIILTGATSGRTDRAHERATDTDIYLGAIGKRIVEFVLDAIEDDWKGRNIVNFLDNTETVRKHAIMQIIAEQILNPETRAHWEEFEFDVSQISRPTPTYIDTILSQDKVITYAPLEVTALPPAEDVHHCEMAQQL